MGWNAVPARARIIASDETQTVLTSLFDRVQGKPWPAEFRGRALRNPFAERWHERDGELLATPPALAEFAAAKAHRDYDRAHLYAGQSVGSANALHSAAEIVRELERGAARHLAAVATLLD